MCMPACIYVILLLSLYYYVSVLHLFYKTALEANKVVYIVNSMRYVILLRVLPYPILRVVDQELCSIICYLFHRILRTGLAVF